jgi:hypothetical protein
LLIETATTDNPPNKDKHRNISKNKKDEDEKLSTRAQDRDEEFSTEKNVDVIR